MLKCRAFCIKLQPIPATPHRKHMQVLTNCEVWADPFSLAATWGMPFRFLFLRILRWFTSPGSLLIPCGIRCFAIKRSRFPYSEIPGSKSVCDSPRHIAAYHVLHRLFVPSHPPKALYSLTKSKLLNSLSLDAFIPPFPYFKEFLLCSKGGVFRITLKYPPPLNCFRVQLWRISRS